MERKLVGKFRNDVAILPGRSIYLDILGGGTVCIEFGGLEDTYTVEEFLRNTAPHREHILWEDGYPEALER